jgi:hypothetical protein
MAIRPYGGTLMTFGLIGTVLRRRQNEIKKVARA